MFHFLNKLYLAPQIACNNKNSKQNWTTAFFSRTKKNIMAEKVNSFYLFLPVFAVKKMNKTISILLKPLNGSTGGHFDYADGAF